MIGNPHVRNIDAARFGHVAFRAVVRLSLSLRHWSCADSLRAFIVAIFTGVVVLAGGGDFHAAVRLVAGETGQLLRVFEALAQAQPVSLRGHDEFFVRVGVAGQEDVDHLIEPHAGLEIEKCFALVQHGHALQVAALAEVHLQITGQLSWVDDGEIRLLRCVHRDAFYHVQHVQLSGAVAAFAGDAGGHVGEPVQRTLDRGGVGVVAGDALIREPAPEAGVVVPEAGRQIPAFFLGVVRHRRLVYVAVDVEDVGIGVLAGADDVIYFFESTVHGVAIFEAVFEHEKRCVIFEKRMVKKVIQRIVHHSVRAEDSARFLPCCPIEGAAHACVDERFVNVGVAGLAGGHADVFHRVVEVEVGAVLTGGVGAGFTKIKKPDGQQG